jgi:cell fate regulator YaaT (PSP1 superfamily)
MTQPENTANTANAENTANAAATTNAAKSPKVQPKKLMLIRFGKMGTLGWFEHNETQVPHTKPHAIIKTSRGLELGHIVGQGNYRSGLFRATPEQVTDYFGPTETGLPVITETGSFVRFATHEDLREQQHLEVSAIAEAKTCEKLTREMNLPMKIVDGEHLFGGERIVIYFTSEGRVDFRELVKRLAKEYQTRIELRQIGSRDEARLIGDYETCGQECCCKRYLKVLAPVNMRMAKLQKATLDPSKISGHCGRLKCCLRYEDETYQELREKLPRKNVIVSTSQGLGRVADVQILTQLVVVQFENGDRQAWPLGEVQVLDNAAATAAFAAAAEAREKNASQRPQSQPVRREMERPRPAAEPEAENAGRQDAPQRENPVRKEEPAELDSQPTESSDVQNGQNAQQSSEQGQRQNRDNSDRGGQRKKKFRSRFNNKNGRSDSNGGQKPNPPQTPGA